MVLGELVRLAADRRQEGSRVRSGRRVRFGNSPNIGQKNRTSYAQHRANSFLGTVIESYTELYFYQLEPLWTC